MARKRGIPVVGAKQLHPVQLSPQVRRIEAHRTREAARREAAPVLASDRSAFGAANREYRTQARSARGATSAVQGSLAEALGGLKASGLSGRYLQQARNEFMSREADAASALPALLAGAQEERSKAILDARQQLLSDRAQMQQSAASDFNQRLKELRGQGSSVLKSEEKEAESGGLSKSELKSLENAGIALHDAIAQWKKDPELQAGNPLQTKEDWLKLAHGLTKEYDGFGLAEAAKVIAALRRRWQKHPGKALKGLVFSPGTTTE